MSIEPQKPNTVLIGKKPTINYVMAALKLLNDEGAEEVVIKARGRNICKAVDTVEMLKNLFIKNLVVKDVKIYSEDLDEEGKRKVSALEITVAKEQK
ncbi:MAG: DNA-binding protein Alba [Aeropyrum sp.]|nr:DNA-binding protein Alba [Aeropyrum sp.]